jgi:small subunit ribosomal protein S16
MLKIRLKRFGRRAQPCYRIVVTDGRVKRDGRAIEEVGFYNPITNETHLKVDRIIERLKTGAQPTDTVRNIFLKAKIFDSL